MEKVEIESFTLDHTKVNGTMSRKRTPKIDKF